MKMTRRNFISASAAAMLVCGASLSAHAAENTTENGLNFITDIFKDPTQPGETEGATTITAEANAEWYEKLDFSDRREFANAERGWLDNAEGRIIDGDDNRSAWDLQSYGNLNRDAPDTVNPSLWRNTNSTLKLVCLKCAMAFIRCAALIWPIRPLSAPTTAGSCLMC